MKPVDLSLEIAGAKLKGDGAGWQIAGADPMAHNAPGKEPPVKIEELRAAATLSVWRARSASEVRSRSRRAASRCCRFEAE